MTCLHVHYRIYTVHIHTRRYTARVAINATDMPPSINRAPVTDRHLDGEEWGGDEKVRGTPPAMPPATPPLHPAHSQPWSAVGSAKLLEQQLEDGGELAPLAISPEEDKRVLRKLDKVSY